MKNKVALITGAGKGLGKAIALRFASEGAAVALAGRSYDLLMKVCEDIGVAGGKAYPVRMDVRDQASVKQAIHEVANRFGKIDTLVNNSGISLVSPSENLSLDSWNDAISTNLTGVFLCSQAVAGYMSRCQTHGSIINISSTFGETPVPYRAAYCASKAAVNMLTKVLAIEWAVKNIRVNAIAPGYLNTEFIQQLEKEGKLDTHLLKKRIPQGRIASVEEITGLAVYMAGDEASYMTGSVVYIDGGWTAYGYI